MLVKQGNLLPQMQFEVTLVITCDNLFIWVEEIIGNVAVKETFGNIVLLAVLLLFMCVCVLFFNEAAVANRNMNNILLYTFKNNGLSQY